MRTQSSLDVAEDALNEISSQVTKLVFEYLTTISERPVRAENYAGKTTDSINKELSAEGVPLDRLLDECRTIMDLSRHNGHPRFFGYVASPSTPIGAYGDLIASALNANITCWRSGPAGTELERMVVRAVPWRRIRSNVNDGHVQALAIAATEIAVAAAQ